MSAKLSWGHAPLGRRTALQAGAVGLLGLGTNHLDALRTAAAPGHAAIGTAKSAIYIFLSGGLAQQDSFDLKPDAPDNIRGEFQSIPTRTPGLQICEHLPQIAQRSHQWSLCRSLTHPSNDHSLGHHIMLTGRTETPPGFSPNQPGPLDWPSIASIGGAMTRSRNNLPPAVVLPDRLMHYSKRVLPGQFAGSMGRRRDPWFIELSPFSSLGYGAYPEYEFDHQERPNMPRRSKFEAPNLSLPEGVSFGRMDRRLDLVRLIDEQRIELDRAGSTGVFDRNRQTVLSLLTDPKVRQAFDVTKALDADQDRYGRNSFGWSLLMAKRLVEVGVNLIQVNLGNNETWDTHGEAFPHLKDQLFGHLLGQR